MIDPLDMSGKVVIVTGGTRGVGKGVAERFLEANATVFVCGRTEPDTLPSVNGSKVRFVCGDVRELEDVDRVTQTTFEATGRIDVLINNAGGSPAARTASVSPRFNEAIIRLNLLAPLNFSQNVNAIMQRQIGGGAIINIASVSGTRPSPGTAAYGAAKAGLINLTQTLAVEWAPHVRVNCIVAGLLQTDAADDHYGGPIGIETVKKSVPLARLGTPRDVANACLFLASPLSAYVSGSALEVHGGGEAPAYLAALQKA